MRVRKESLLLGGRLERAEEKVFKLGSLQSTDMNRRQEYTSWRRMTEMTEPVSVHPQQQPFVLNIGVMGVVSEPAGIAVAEIGCRVPSMLARRNSRLLPKSEPDT